MDNVGIPEIIVRPLFTGIEDISMSGGKKRALDHDHITFIRNVPFMKDWPLERLTNNPSAGTLQHFKYGQVVMKDSNTSEWIYVVKSGSLSLMKKLQEVKATIKRDPQRTKPVLNVMKSYKDRRRKRREVSPWKPPEEEIRTFRSNVELDMTLGDTLPGISNPTERLGVINYDEVVTKFRTHVRRPSSVKLPAIASATQRRQEKEHRPSKEQLTLPAIHKTTKGVYIASPGNRRRGSRRDTEHNETQDPAHIFDTSKANNNPRTQGIEIRFEKDALSGGDAVSDFHPPPPEGAKVPVSDLRPPPPGDTKMPVSDLHPPRPGDTKVSPIDRHPMFIVVQVLEKGQYFGVRELVFSNQPSMSLVSNGAECILIPKSLYLQHASDDNLRNIKAKEVPFPQDEELQTKLQEYINWRAYRAQTYRKMVRQKQLRDAYRRQHAPQFGGQYNFRAGPH